MSKWKVVLKAEGRNPGQIEERVPPPKPEFTLEEPKKPKGRLNKATKEAWEAEVASFERAQEEHEREVREWEAREKKEAENTGGVIVMIQNGSMTQEVSRVAFIRRQGVCKNPDVPFEEQLSKEVAKAKQAVALANDLFAEADGERL